MTTENKGEMGAPAAQGASGEPRTAQEYRLLQLGEIIQAGDESWKNGRGPWGPVEETTVGDTLRSWYNPMRRPLPDAAGVPKPQAEGSPEVTPDKRDELIAELVDALRWVTGATDDCPRCERVRGLCIGHAAIAKAEARK